MVSATADTASQGLVIGIGAATVAVITLLAGAVYRMIDGLQSQIKDTRDDLRNRITETGADTRDDLRNRITETWAITNGNVETLATHIKELDRDMVEVKTRLQYEATGQATGRPPQASGRFGPLTPDDT